MPQAPQLAALEVVSTQVPAQASVGKGQLAVHIRFTQNGVVVPHRLPHVPQFCALLARSVQTPPHLSVHCAAAPADAPPAPGELPLPLPPKISRGGSLVVQLIASMAGNTRVSEAPTICARSEPRFSRNRFHIGAPNLKSSKGRGAAPPRHNSACFTLLPL